MADKSVVCFDMDGVLARFNAPFARLLIEAQGEDLFPEGWEQAGDAEGWVVCWDWPTLYGYTAVSQELAWHALRESGNFWHRLPEYSNAPKVLDQLETLSATDAIDLYFITQRSGIWAKRQAEMWLYDRGIMTPTVLVTGNKIPVLKALGANFFLDDRLDTVKAADKADLPGVYLLDRPWNREGRPDDLQVVYTIEDALIEAGLWVDLSPV